MTGSENPACLCTNLECPRHGLCAVCTAYHAQAGTPTTCAREQLRSDQASMPQAAKQADPVEGSAEGAER